MEFSFKTNLPEELYPGEPEIEVKVDAWPADASNWEYPGEPAGQEVYSVLRNGVEIIDTLSIKTLDGLRHEAEAAAVGPHEG